MSLCLYLIWATAVILAAISVHRLLSSVYIGRYADWSQEVMLGISLATVYLLPLLGQAHIAMQCHRGEAEDFCRIPYNVAMAWHDINNTAGETYWDLMLKNSHPCRGQTLLAHSVTILFIVLASNVSLPIILCCKRLKK